MRNGAGRETRITSGENGRIHGRARWACGGIFAKHGEAAESDFKNFKDCQDFKDWGAGNFGNL